MKPHVSRGAARPQVVKARTVGRAAEPASARPSRARPQPQGAQLLETAPLWIGIDVAKAQLDVAIGATGDAWSVSNDEPGIEKLLADLRSRNCSLVVLEATGGFELAAVSALAAALPGAAHQHCLLTGSSPR